jgi:hypothetical protein
MTRAALLLFALFAAFAAGAWGARQGRRAWERVGLGPRRVRPAAVEAALAAWERGGAAPPTAAAAARDPESAADLALLAAVAAGTDRALLDMAREHDGRDASARALWELVRRAPDAATRAVRRRAFAARWPAAWVLARPDGAP